MPSIVVYCWADLPSVEGFRCYDNRGVATAGDTGDASPVRPTMSPYIKMTTDSLSSELTFDD